MSRLALGTAQLGFHYGVANTRGQVESTEARRILDTAWAAGVDTLDTAMGYGDSESRLGALDVSGWRIVTKLPAVPEGCADVASWVKAAVGASLRRLGVDSVYGLLLHSPAQLLTPLGPALYLALRQAKADGVAQKIGVSVYDPAELEGILDRYGVDLVQAPVNVVDRRLVRSGWLARLAERGIEVHARSVFLQGLLLMPPSQRSALFRQWSPLFETWDGFLEESGRSAVEACLAHVISLKEISRFVVGVDSSSQLRDILAAANKPPAPAPEALESDDCDLINPSRWN